MLNQGYISYMIFINLCNENTITFILCVFFYLVQKSALKLLNTEVASTVL